MALVTNFKNILYSFLGTTSQPEVVYQCDAGKTNMLLSIDICNKSNTGIQCDLIIHDASANADFYLLRNAPIPVGGTLPVVVHQKHVLEENDTISVNSNVQASVDVIGARMEVFTQ